MRNSFRSSEPHIHKNSSRPYYRFWCPAASCSGSVWGRSGRPRWSGCHHRRSHPGGKAVTGAPVGTGCRWRLPLSPETPPCPCDPWTRCRSPPSGDCRCDRAETQTRNWSFLSADEHNRHQIWWRLIHWLSRLPEFPTQQVVDDVRVGLDQTHQDLLLQLCRDLREHTSDSSIAENN